MKSLFVVLFTLATLSYHAEACSAKNAQCLTETTYQFCFTVGTDVVLVDGVMTCAAGTVCSETEGQYICIEGTTSPPTTTVASTTPATEPTTTPTTQPTTITTTPTTQPTTITTTITTQPTTVTTATTVAPTGPPDSCTQSGKYAAAACNQYWECLAVMWWYELVLQTCDTNQQYNATAQACAANSTCIV